MPNIPLSGVFPVLPTPFDDAGAIDVSSLRRCIDYLLRAGVDGMTYPGVASEVAQLTTEERASTTEQVLAHVAGRVPVIVGASSSDPETTIALAQEGAVHGAAAFMVAAPADRKMTASQIEYFTAVAKAAPEAAIMLQNVPPPAGAGLDPDVLLELIRAVPGIQYVKEETLPSGQRLTALLNSKPAHLSGVFGGAGGRYITDELRRGASGTMPAIELAEIHVALFAAHREGDAERVRNLFTRMLPILNVQAVFRWSLTKYVLQRRGIIASTRQRTPGPLLDALDRADVDDFLRDLADLLLTDNDLR